MLSAAALCTRVAPALLLFGATMAGAQSAPPARAAPDRFEIAAFDVSGVHALDVRTVEDAVYPFAGPAKSATDVEGARKALEDAYKAHGYESVLVEIPPQPNGNFVAGVVTLKVTEATVGRLRVVGSKYHALTVVEAQLPALKEGAVPDLKTAADQLAEANRFPDREITPSIRAGTIPGTIDIDLKVRDTLPFHASLTVNNDHSSSTEPLRIIASARYTNLFQLGHTLTASYLVAPQDRRQSEVFSGSYLAPIIGSRWTILAFGYKSNSNIAALGGTQVLGNGYDLGLRAIYRLPGGDVQQSISFGPDYKNFKEDVFIPASDPALPGTTIQTPIKYVPLTVGYTVQRTTEHTAANVNLTVSAGLRGLASSERIIQTRRFDAIGNFVRVNLDGDYTRSFKGDFIGVLRFAGQLADSPLVTNEQFSIGGHTTVRGYYQSEAVGDDGVNGSVELRSPSFAGRLGSFVDEARLFVFADAGFVRVRRPLPEQTSTFRLVSVGGGGRFQLLRHLEGNVAYGVPLTTGTATGIGDGQIVFSVKTDF